jgi:hypothetical protein
MAKKEVFEYQYRYLGDAKDIDIDTLTNIVELFDYLLLYTDKFHYLC